jgi:hypothetical protein
MSKVFKDLHKIIQNSRLSNHLLCKSLGYTLVCAPASIMDRKDCRITASENSITNLIEKVKFVEFSICMSEMLTLKFILFSYGGEIYIRHQKYRRNPFGGNSVNKLHHFGINPFGGNDVQCEEEFHFQKINFSQFYACLLKIHEAFVVLKKKYAEYTQGKTLGELMSTSKSPFINDNDIILELSEDILESLGIEHANINHDVSCKMKDISISIYFPEYHEETNNSN